MHWRVGAATITTIVEQPLKGLAGLIPAASPDAVAAIDWLHPHFADADGKMHGLIQAFVVRTPSRLVVVDTCVGDGRDRRTMKMWNQAQTGFMERFRAAGFDPLEVDVVLCTHLHVDHVGWNTYWDGRRWAPTFPGARYLFAETELAHWEAERTRPARDPDALDDLHEKSMAAFDLDMRQTHADAIQPLLDAGLVDAVTTDHRVCDEIDLVPTPGHTPGHVSVRIRSEGAGAVITGDCIHHPCQIARPEWRTVADADAEQGVVTRRALLDELSGGETLLLGSHFSAPTAGRVVGDGDGFRLLWSEADAAAMATGTSAD